MTGPSSSRELLLSVKDLRVHFAIRSESPWPWTPTRALKAVDGVSFDQIGRASCRERVYVLV